MQGIPGYQNAVPIINDGLHQFAHYIRSNLQSLSTTDRHLLQDQGSGSLPVKQVVRALVRVHLCKLQRSQAGKSFGTCNFEGWSMFIHEM